MAGASEEKCIPDVESSMGTACTDWQKQPDGMSYLGSPLPFMSSSLTCKVTIG